MTGSGLTWQLKMHHRKMKQKEHRSSVSHKGFVLLHAFGLVDLQTNCETANTFVFLVPKIC